MRLSTNGKQGKNIKTTIEMSTAHTFIHLACTSSANAACSLYRIVHVASTQRADIHVCVS